MFRPGNEVKADAAEMYIYHEWYNLTGAPPMASWLFPMEAIASIRNHSQNIFDRRNILCTIDRTKTVMKHPSAVPGNNTAIFLDARVELEQRRCRAVHFDFTARRAIVYGSPLGYGTVKSCLMREDSYKLSALWSILADVMDCDGATEEVYVYHIDGKLDHANDSNVAACQILRYLIMRPPPRHHGEPIQPKLTCAHVGRERLCRSVYEIALTGFKHWLTCASQYRPVPPTNPALMAFEHGIIEYLPFKQAMGAFVRATNMCPTCSGAPVRPRILIPPRRSDPEEQEEFTAMPIATEPTSDEEEAAEGIYPDSNSDGEQPAVAQQDGNDDDEYGSDSSEEGDRREVRIEARGGMFPRVRGNSNRIPIPNIRFKTLAHRDDFDDYEFGPTTEQLPSQSYMDNFPIHLSDTIRQSQGMWSEFRDYGYRIPRDFHVMTSLKHPVNPSERLFPIPPNGTPIKTENTSDSESNSQTGSASAMESRSSSTPTSRAATTRYGSQSQSGTQRNSVAISDSVSELNGDLPNSPPPSRSESEPDDAQQNSQSDSDSDANANVLRLDFEELHELVGSDNEDVAFIEPYLKGTVDGKDITLHPKIFGQATANPPVTISTDIDSVIYVTHELHIKGIMKILTGPLRKAKAPINHHNHVYVKILPPPTEYQQSQGIHRTDWESQRTPLSNIPNTHFGEIGDFKVAIFFPRLMHQDDTFRRRWVTRVPDEVHSLFVDEVLYPSLRRVGMRHQKAYWSHTPEDVRNRDGPNDSSTGKSYPVNNEQLIEFQGFMDHFIAQDPDLAMFGSWFLVGDIRGCKQYTT
ncbi:hypothetical protein BD410DRAFT_847017, partial [Rickenella mellea]